MTKVKFKELKHWVEKVLQKYEKARNSDPWLTIKLYCDEFPGKVKNLPEGKAFLCEDLVNLPDPQTITRIRRKFNQGKKDKKTGEWIIKPMYLATDPEVIKERAKKERKIKHELKVWTGTY